jgi:glyoxylate reductase
LLISPEIFSAHKEWAAISEIADVVEPKARSREEFLEECKSGVFDKVVAAYRTFQSVAITGLIDEELVSILPKSLKFIAHNGMELLIPLCGETWRANRVGIGAGYDQIDVHVCTEHDIRISNVPTAVDDATADTNLFLILGALRGFNACKVSSIGSGSSPDIFKQ